ncbi:MAG: spore germination protein [Clostridia bacterium]|nr:spore germination protein [Clostridia bacterium]MDD4686214.1 spore germination protein [Clostridia bacterium]
MFFSCDENINYFKSRLNNNMDVVNKSFKIEEKEVAVIYIKSLIDEKLLGDIILTPLHLHKKKNITVSYIADNIISTADLEKIENSETANDDIVFGMLLGKVAIFVGEEDNCLLVDIQMFPDRVPSEPPTSAVLYGPRVGFTENSKKNISMIRKSLPTENLVFEKFEVGTFTKTSVILTYLKGVADNKIVKDLSKKIQNIKTDGIVDSHYILSFLQKGETSFFKQAGLAEKPDIITAKLLEGRVAIVVDGSPVVLTVPFLIFEDIQNSNDYYTNPIYTCFIRIIRLIGILVASIAPGVYLALRLYHDNIIPFRFLMTISNSTQGLPFTPFMELIFILILFQILYEVSLRLPRYLGLATSIVGALILGDTGVNAGLISQPGVVIIAMSIISIYIVPDQAAQLSLLRVIFLIIGGTVGLLGIAGGAIYIINEMAMDQKYNVPYLFPYAAKPTNKTVRDGILMEPISKMKSKSQKNTEGSKNKRGN